MSHTPSNNRQPFGVKNQQSVAARAAATAAANQNNNSPNLNLNNIAADKPALNTPRPDKTNKLPPPPARSLSLPRTAQTQSTAVTTPKKRAVPHEDVHCRNVVEDRDRDSPSKRSRSSKDSSTEGTDPSTGTGLARGMGGVSVETSSRPVSSLSTKGQTSTSALPSQATRPTTKRIDKASRMTEGERLARERNKSEETKIWRQKYAKAFPTFTFYLDSLEEPIKAGVEAAIEQFGGVSDQVGLGGTESKFLGTGCRREKTGRLI